MTDLCQSQIACQNLIFKKCEMKQIKVSKSFRMDMTALSTNIDSMKKKPWHLSPGVSFVSNVLVQNFLSVAYFLLWVTILRLLGDYP